MQEERTDINWQFKDEVELYQKKLDRKMLAIEFLFRRYFEEFEIKGETLKDKILNLMKAQQTLGIGRFNKNLITYDIGDNENYKGINEIQHIIEEFAMAKEQMAIDLKDIDR